MVCCFPDDLKVSLDGIHSHIGEFRTSVNDANVPLAFPYCFEDVVDALFQASAHSGIASARAPLETDSLRS